MYLAYFDESGDSGNVSVSPTKFYVISCVLVHEAEWLKTLDLLVRIRRRMKTAFKIAVTPEIKATDFRKGTGPLKHLGWSPAQRAQLFNNLLGYQTRLGITTFAIAIDKGKLHAGRNPREVAWQYTIQRVDTFCRKSEQRAVLYPDAGHGYFIQKLVRRLRRHQIIGGHYGGSLAISATRILEDPSDRQSHESFFVQLADWNAFAAHRSAYVDPVNPHFSGSWDYLGVARLLPVNKVKGGSSAPPGIVVYP